MENLIFKRISLSKEIHMGKPCIQNTRIPVYAILELLREGISFNDIIHNYYPEIIKEDIQACIDYAAHLIKDEEIHIINS